EITGLEARSTGELSRKDLATPRALHDARRVSQHSLERRMSAQDGGQEYATASAHVGHRLPMPEVVDLGDRRRPQRRDRGHRLVEDAFFLRTRAQVLEGALPQYLLAGRNASLQ